MHRAEGHVVKHAGQRGERTPPAVQHAAAYLTGSDRSPVLVIGRVTIAVMGGFLPETAEVGPVSPAVR